MCGDFKKIESASDELIFSEKMVIDIMSNEHNGSSGWPQANETIKNLIKALEMEGA